MKEAAKTTFAVQSESRSARKAYKRPELRDFGKLHLVTLGAGTANGDTGQVMMPPPSDRRCKDRIVRVGVHPLGIGLYLFDYKPEFRDEWGHGRQFGVMADEVESVLPEAVSVHPGGYKRVNYGMLGFDRPGQ